MPTHHTQDLWRLLKNLEQLMEEEQFHIQKFNFASLDSVLNKKEAIITELINASNHSGINRKTNTEFNTRMSHIILFQKEIAATLSKNLHQVKQELHSTKKTKSTIKGIKGSYATNPNSSNDSPQLSSKV